MSRSYNVRQVIFPYGMEKSADGSWTFFNRQYKPVGIISDSFLQYDDPKHKLFLKGLGPKTLAKLDIHGKGTGTKIYFYNDGSNPEYGRTEMENYLEKMRILLRLSGEYRQYY